jgi:hypothetical protein
MSNIKNLPPNKKSGLYKGELHSNGGIQVIVDDVSKVEVEGHEYHLCPETLMNEEILEFKNKTNKEILEAIFQRSKCVFEQGKAESKSFIVCKLVVLDDTKRTINGTAKEIINILQTEKACNVTEDAKNKFETGGYITEEETAKIRLEALKRMYSKKPSKELKAKMNVIKKMIDSGHYKKGGIIKHKPENMSHDLVCIYKLSYAQLLFADKMGGTFYMPSLGIVRLGETISGFGDIVFIASKNIIDPIPKVAKDKDNYLVSEEEFKTYVKEQKEIWSKLVDEVVKFSEDKTAFNEFDNLSKAVGIISKYKTPTDEQISSALRKNRYSNVPVAYFGLIRDMATNLRNAPTKYFEVKISSVLPLGVFVAAVIPHVVIDVAKPILNSYGIHDIVAYDSQNNIYDNQADAIEVAVAKLESKESVLFRDGGIVNA